MTAAAWVAAGELVAGDTLLLADGSTSVVTAVSATTAEQTVHNLTVADLHTYYVLVGDAAVLVHNCPPGIRNESLAGDVHPSTGVPFDEAGFPNFSAFRHPDVPDVKISPSGTRSGDFARANEAAGLPGTPTGYTWHHNQEFGVMQLIDRVVHAGTGHTGGFSIWGRIG